MKRAWVVALGILVLTGCHSKDASIAMAKFDAPLRMKVEQIHQAGQHETLSLFGKCGSPIDDRMKQSIVKTGATLTSANEDLFTARVPSQRLMKLANLEFVTQLQLSQTSQPSSQ